MSVLALGVLTFRSVHVVAVVCFKSLGPIIASWTHPSMGWQACEGESSIVGSSTISSRLLPRLRFKRCQVIFIFRLLLDFLWQERREFGLFTRRVMQYLKVILEAVLPERVTHPVVPRE